MAIDQDVEELLVMGNSDLIIRQAQDEWETWDVKLIPYKQHVENLSKRFKSVEFRYIPCFHNELADVLTTLASMLPYPGNLHIDPLEIQIGERHGYCNMAEMEPNVQPSYHDIKRSLKMKEYPEQSNGDQKRTIRRLASDLFLSGEVLYKRTPDLNLLRCVDAEEAGRIIYEVRAGVCGPHMNG
uniref:RNase H type-1 domain-containing protein n=1 Tax=Nicotiana tabacum TaxID=4097 RepID=A0A1S4CL66_TOBAC